MSKKHILRSAQDDNPLRVLAERFLAMLREERGAGERGLGGEVGGLVAWHGVDPSLNPEFPLQE